jgi:hypothetical protein
MTRTLTSTKLRMTRLLLRRLLVAGRRARRAAEKDEQRAPSPFSFSFFTCSARAVGGILLLALLLAVSPAASYQGCDLQISRRGAIQASMASWVTLVVAPTSSSTASAATPSSGTDFSSLRELRSTYERKKGSAPAPPDVYYPDQFAGTWRVRSVTKSVIAPQGPEAFPGGADGLKRAMESVGQELVYKARFRSVAGGTIADRVYNIDSLSSAAMGGASLLNSELVDGSPDELLLFIAPAGDASRNGVYRADLRLTSREVDATKGGVFEATEVVKQTVTGPRLRNPLIKDVATTTIYQLGSDWRALEGEQYVAQFQSGDDSAVDLRVYELHYERLGV